MIHEVVSGDSLWRIAVQHGCAVEDLRASNALTSDLIRPGQRLTVPFCEREAEPLEEGSVTVAIAPEGGTSYTIQPGDVLERIAMQFGCSQSELMAANGMRTDSIYAGSTLQIPRCTGAAVEAAAEADPDGTYRVRPGDTLGFVAEQHGCSVAEVLAENARASDMVRAGELLRIPQACTGAQPAVAGAPTAAPPRSAVDTSRLSRLMAAQGFRGGSSFKALVVEITFNAARDRVVEERRFDYNGTSDDVTGWNPASTVKLFAAIAALQRAAELGFTSDAVVTFRGRQTRTASLDELVTAAIGPSDNIAYNRLVQFVGYDRMNEQFLSRRNGLRSTALRRPYARSEWMGMGESSSFRETPAIEIREGGRRRELPATVGGNAGGSCQGSACTTLQDLAEAMRRLMLQEQLPASQHFGLPRGHLLTLRQQLRTGRSRGQEVVDRLGRDFGPDVRFYHKAGFAEDWYSDNVYIFDPRSRQAWIVTMANHPGRSSLNQAADVIGRLITEGAFRR